MRWIFAATMAAAFPALAQQGGSGSGSGNADDIARKLSDPGATLISVPFQYNFFGDAGLDGDSHNQQLKIQPVIPFVFDHGKFLLRPILPYQWNEFPEHRHGFSDLFVEGYYIRGERGEHKPTEVGFGFAAGFDTANHDSLGSGRYTLGPAFVLIHKTAHWTMGSLLNHVWSIGGDSDRDDVVVTSLNPFFTRALDGGWSMSFSSESSYNWEADSGEGWKIPLGMSVSKVTHFGKRPVSFSGGAFYFVERPEDAPEWNLRLSVTLVFPE